MKSSASELAAVQAQEEINATSTELAKQVSSALKVPTAGDIEVRTDKAVKLPIAEMAALGSAFAALPESFRTIAQTIEPAAGQLYSIVFPEGATGALKAAKDGGFHGFSIMADGSSKLATLVPASGAQSVTTVVPVDPTTLLVAVALMEINKKFDAIQETQREMFEYIRNRDKAELRGNLETLSDILRSYSFFWDSQQYKSSKLILAQSIRSNAENAIIQHRAEIRGSLEKGKLLHGDRDVRKKTAAVRSELEEYRLAVYTYAFSSFLEIMLLENFDQGYLRSMADKIEQRSIEYRELYTQAYNLIEADADSSARAMAFDGISSAMGFLGKAIEKTPVGARTAIDEALVEAGRGLADYNEAAKRNTLSRLTDARSSDVRPFVESIEEVGRLYNTPTMLLADEESVYLLPISEDSFEV